MSIAGYRPRVDQIKIEGMCLEIRAYKKLIYFTPAENLFLSILFKNGDLKKRKCQANIEYSVGTKYGNLTDYG